MVSDGMYDEALDAALEYWEDSYEFYGEPDPEMVAQFESYSLDDFMDAIERDIENDKDSWWNWGEWF